MDNVKVNVDSFDQNSHTIIVSFSGTENGVEYNTQKYAFNTSQYYSLYGIFTVEDAIKKLAQVGLSYLQQEVIKSNAINNDALMSQLSALNNTTHNFAASDLINSMSPNNTNMVDNLEIQI